MSIARCATRRPHHFPRRLCRSARSPASSGLPPPLSPPGPRLAPPFSCLSWEGNVHLPSHSAHPPSHGPPGRPAQRPSHERPRHGDRLHRPFLPCPLIGAAALHPSHLVLSSLSLIVVGAHYLPFAFLYGMRQFSRARSAADRSGAAHRPLSAVQLSRSARGSPPRCFSSSPSPGRSVVGGAPASLVFSIARAPRARLEFLEAGPPLLRFLARIDPPPLRTRWSANAPPPAISRNTSPSTMLQSTRASCSMAHTPC